MHYDDFVAAIRREGADCVRAARATGVDAKVPSCADWTVADLCSHLGRLHRWVVEVIELRPKPFERYWETIDTPDGGALLDFLESGYAPMADALGTVAPTEPMWSWTDDRTAGFWARRQAHELAVHRWDAQLAGGIPQPIERALAVDGIQEVFDILPFRLGAKYPGGNDETIHLHCTDSDDGEWLLRIGAERLEVTREHAKGDVAARGTASDLLLVLWGRYPPEQLEVFGDADLLRRFRNARL
ncbi:MAG: maleylpyruvate isomerase family mycothiol-dependent enzyme [Actinomycetota bacterium]